MNTDIVIKEDGYRFNYRVGVYFLNKGKILLQKASTDEYFSLLGGRVKHNETTREAVIRELEEEVGIKILPADLKLNDVVENFFEYNGTNIHELLFIYKVETDKYVKVENTLKVLDKDSVEVKWLNLSEIKDIDLRPKIVKATVNSDKIIHSEIK